MTRLAGAAAVTGAATDADAFFRGITRQVYHLPPAEVTHCHPPCGCCFAAILVVHSPVSEEGFGSLLETITTLKDERVRINQFIRARELRVIGADGGI